MSSEISRISVIKDPEVAKLFADDTRRRILHILRHREMSATDLAKALERNHSSIQHHLNLLKNAGLISLTREKKVRNMIQPYYRATARSFIISYSLTDALIKDDGYSTWREDTIKKIFEGLKTFDMKIPEDVSGRVRQLMGTCYERERIALEEVINKQNDPGKLIAYVQRALIRLMTNIKLSNDKVHSSAIQELNKLLRI